jgi:hypothetical protein
MAPALENQCIVVQAPTVGPCAFCPALDENIGAAAIYGPPDHGFPANGISSQTRLSHAGWAVYVVWRDGRVLNHCHWSEQIQRLGVKDHVQRKPRQRRLKRAQCPR